MADPQMTETLAALSPAELEEVKGRLRQLPREKQNIAFKRLASVPALSDMVGKIDTSVPAGETKKKSGLEKVFEAVDAPSKWFGAFVTDWATPAVEGTENLNYFRRQQAEYEQWKEPVLGTTPWGYKIQPTKGLVESAPWALVPGAGGVVSKLGGAAAKKGLLGAGARAAVSALKPAAFVDTATEQAVGKLLNAVTKAKPIRQSLNVLSAEQHGKAGAAYEAVSKAAGSVPGNVWAGHEAGSKAMVGIKRKPAELSDAFKKAVGDISESDNKILQDMTEGVLKPLETKELKDALKDLIENEVVPTRSQVGLFEKVYGEAVARAFLDLRTPAEKLKDFSWELLNAPRSLLASMDLSFMLRQGGMLAARNPKEALRTLKPAIKAAFSAENEKLMDLNIKATPWFKQSQVHGLNHVEVSGLANSISNREEAFMGNFFKQFFPWIPKELDFVSSSNRAYVTGLNSLRNQMWGKTTAMWQRAGKQVTDNDLDELARFLNYATGRGDLKIARIGLDTVKQGGLLSTMLFSPRLLTSRFQVLGMAKSTSPLVRKEAISTLFQDLGVGSSLLTAAVMSGMGTVDVDPRSTDFGKLKIGSTRYDIWTGYSQYARFLAQLATAQKKTDTGRISDIPRSELIGRFVQSKSSPLVGLFVDIARGETYSGEDIPFKTSEGLRNQIKERLMPLVLQDTIDAVQQEGLFIGTSVGLSSFYGIGTTTYVNEVKQAEDKIANAKYGMDFDDVGKEVNKVAQMEIAQDPKVMKLQKTRELEMGLDTKSTMGQYQNLGDSIEDHYKRLVNNAVNAFRADQNGVLFRKAMSDAKKFRRESYAARSERPEFTKITNYYMNLS